MIVIQLFKQFNKMCFDPLLPGFARSFGMRLADGERREWIKPIMFSGGLGSIEDTHVKKEEAAAGNALAQCVRNN